MLWISNYFVNLGHVERAGGAAGLALSAKVHTIGFGVRRVKSELPLQDGRTVMSMRIHKPQILASHTGLAPMGPPGTKPINAPSTGDNWASRIAKMIPAEAIVFYSTLLPYVKGNEVGLITIAVLGWIVAMVVRHFGMKEENKDKPQMGGAGGGDWRLRPVADHTASWAVAVRFQGRL